MEILCYVFLFAEVIFLGRIDKFYYKTILTPFQIIAYPFIIILSVYLLVYRQLEFYKITPNALILWIIGLFLLWLSGMLILILTNYKIIPKKNVNSVKNYDFSNIMSLFVYITLPLLIIKFAKALILFNGFSALGYDEFPKYFGSGIVGHIMTLYLIIFIYLLAFSKLKSKLQIIAIIIVSISFFLYQVKSWIFIPIISSLICRIYLNKVKLNFKFYFLVILVSFFIFVSVYIFSFRRDVELNLFSIISFYTESTQFLFKHSLSYCFSGILGLSGHLNQNMPVGVDKSLLINNFKNIYFFLFDRNEISSAVTTYFVKI